MVWCICPCCYDSLVIPWDLKTSCKNQQQELAFQNNLFNSSTSNDTTYIKKSIDLGNSWTTLFQHYQVGNQPYNLSFVDNSNAYFINPNELDRVYKTSDGFLSTDTILITTGDLVLQEQFDFIDLENGYHYGSWGSQSNPTRTWNTGTFYFPIDLDGFGVLPVLDLDFNTSRLYASSLYGKIFFSLNNGQNWTEQVTPISDPIYSISFFPTIFNRIEKICVYNGFDWLARFVNA